VCGTIWFDKSVRYDFVDIVTVVTNS